MREILFKGKSLGNEWAYGVPMKYDGKCFMVEDLSIDETEDFTAAFTIEVDCETVGQYTGLKDRNGKKIFEGDILLIDNVLFKCDTDYAYYGIVIWDDCNFCIKAWKNPKSKVRGIMRRGVIEMRFNSSETEIIGNIYDNSELLEGETE